MATTSFTSADEVCTAINKASVQAYCQDATPIVGSVLYTDAAYTTVLPSYTFPSIVINGVEYKLQTNGSGIITSLTACTSTASGSQYPIIEPLLSILKGTNLPTSPNTVRFNLFNDIDLSNLGVYTVYQDLPHFKDAQWRGGTDTNLPLKKGGFNATGHGFNYSGTSTPMARRYNWSSALLTPTNVPQSTTYPFNYWIDSYLANMPNRTASTDYQFGIDYFNGSGVTINYDPSIGSFGKVFNYQFDFEVYLYNGQQIAGDYNFSKEFFKGFLDAAQAYVNTIDSTKRFALTLYGWNITTNIIDRSNSASTPQNLYFPLITTDTATIDSYVTINPDIVSVINRLKDNSPTAPLVLLENGWYLKASYPEDVTKYQLNLDGTVKRDVNNRPFLRRDDFVAHTRGETVNFYSNSNWNRINSTDALYDGALDVFMGTTPDIYGNTHVGIHHLDGTPQADGYTDNIWYWWMRTEVHNSVWMSYRHFSRLVCGRIGLNKVFIGNADFENHLYDTQNILLDATCRWMTEGCAPEPFGGDISEKQLSPFQVSTFFWQTVCINRGMQWWCGSLSYADNSEMNGIIPIRHGYDSNYQGQPLTIYNPSGGRNNPNYSTGYCGVARHYLDANGNVIGADYSEPNHLRDMSIVEQIIALQQTMGKLHSDYGFFSQGDALWVFTDPLNVKNQDVMAWALKRGTTAVFFFSNPQLDINIPSVSVKIIIGTSVITTVNVNVNECFPYIVNLPNSAITGNDIKIQYTNIQGVLTTVNGKFQSS